MPGLEQFLGGNSTKTEQFLGGVLAGTEQFLGGVSSGTEQIIEGVLSVRGFVDMQFQLLHFHKWILTILIFLWHENFGF